MESVGDPSAETESENKSPDSETQKDSPETTAETETPQSENKDTLEEAVVEKTPTPVKKPEKINIILKPVGDAPIIKQKLWAVEADRPISSVIAFVRKYLKKPSGEGLFFFVNQAFAPSPDQLVRNLYECFGADGKLVLHYSTTTAWG